MMMETYQLEKYKTTMSERIIEATWGHSEKMGTNIQEAIKNYMSTRRLK